MSYEKKKLNSSWFGCFLRVGPRSGQRKVVIVLLAGVELHIKQNGRIIGLVRRVED